MSVRIAAILVAIVGLFLSAADGEAQTYPARVITLVVPVPAGGPLDLTSRVLAEHLGERLKQTVIVENRPGAGTLLAAQVVARAQPDAYTILLGSASLASYSVFIRDPKVDVLKDFEFVSTFGRLPYVLAATNVRPLKTVADIKAYSAANPGKLNYATYGNHSWLSTEVLNRAAGITGVRIPYQGSAPAHLALAAGDVDIILTDLGTLRPLLDAGKATLVAVGSEKRIPEFPEVPTLREAGVDLPPLEVWYGVVAPAKSPRSAIDLLSREINEVGKMQAVRDRLQKVGIEPKTSTSADFKTQVEREQELFSKTAAVVGIKPE